MSERNVEIVRAVFDAYNRGDLDATFEHIAPDCEFDQTRALGTDRGVYDRSQARRLMEEFASIWESLRFDADELIDAGEHVVMPFTNSLRGRDGIEVQARGTYAFSFREGSIVRVCLYQERQEALEAVGYRSSDVAG